MPHVQRSKIRISITILPFINDMLEKVCKQSGASKSSIIEDAVRIFLQKKLDKDSKALARLRFDDLPTEDEWFLIQSPVE